MFRKTSTNNKVDVADWYTNNYPYTKENTEFVITDVADYFSLENIKFASSTYNQGINLSAKNFNVSGINHPINFRIDPGKVGTPSADNFQTIEGLHGYGQTFDTGEASLVRNEKASPGVAAIAQSGQATFAPSDTTLAQHLLAVEAGIATAEADAGQGAMWQEGPDAFLFVSDGVDGLSDKDILVKLVGISLNDPNYDYLMDLGQGFSIG